VKMILFKVTMYHNTHHRDSTDSSSYATKKNTMTVNVAASSPEIAMTGVRDVYGNSDAKLVAEEIANINHLFELVNCHYDKK